MSNDPNDFFKKYLKAQTVITEKANDMSYEEFSRCMFAALEAKIIQEELLLNDCEDFYGGQPIRVPMTKIMAMISDEKTMSTPALKRKIQEQKDKETVASN